MAEMTLGKLLWETATGTTKKRKITPAENEAIRKNISANASKQIEAVRREQRRALEDSRNIVVR